MMKRSGVDEAQTSEGVFASWPASVWTDMLMTGPWKTLAPSNFGMQPVKTLQTGQDKLLDETKQMVDQWCDRRHKSVQDVQTLSDELRQAKTGPEMMSAWMSWYRVATDRIGEDFHDQLAYSREAATYCAGMMPNGLSVSIPQPSVNEKDRAQTNGKSRYRNS